MAVTQEVHLNDIGTIFRITLLSGSTAVDVSGASSKYILFRKPDGTTLQKTATFYTDGSDGIVEYTAVSGDLNATGTWKIQARVTLTNGTWSSNQESFKVYPNIV